MRDRFSPSLRNCLLRKLIAARAGTAIDEVKRTKDLDLAVDRLATLDLACVVLDAHQTAAQTLLLDADLKLQLDICVLSIAALKIEA